MTTVQISTRRAELEKDLRRHLPASNRDADLSHLGDPELIGGRRRLGALLNECGCRAGEFTMLAALLLAAGHIVAGRRWRSPLRAVIGIVELTAACIVGGGVGKGMGILSARVRYRRVARRLTGVQP